MHLNKSNLCATKISVNKGNVRNFRQYKIAVINTTLPNQIFIYSLYNAEACREFAAGPISALLRLGSTAPFEIS